MQIEHNGQQLEFDIKYDSVSEGYQSGPAGPWDDAGGIDGLYFDILGVDGRDPTPEEKEKLDEALSERFDKDDKFSQLVSEVIRDDSDYEPPYDI